MSIDNAALEFDVAPYVSGDVEIIAWRGDAGFIEYRDGQRVMEKTTRLEDYLAPIDAWLTVASQTSPSITLTQAQQIKIDLVDTLYENKRTAIFTAVAKLGGKMSIKTIAVTNDQGVPCSPCGACRQVIYEFGPDATVYFLTKKNEWKEVAIIDLLPEGFRLS